MDADLFSPTDAAALLAIRAVMAERMLGPLELRALFDASGLIRSAGAGRRAAMKTSLPLASEPVVPASGDRSADAANPRR